MRSTPRFGIRYATLDDSNDPIIEEYTAEDAEKTIGKLTDPVVLIAHTNGAPHIVGNTATDVPVGTWTTYYASPAATATGAFISPGGIHVKERGIYLVAGGLTFEPTAALGRRGAWPAVGSIGVTAVGVGTADRAIIPASAEGTSVPMVAQPIILNPDDFVSIIPYQSSGATINFNNGTLSVTLIGRLP